jgi:hypothetical protein
MSGIKTNCNNLKQWYLEVGQVNVDGTFAATAPFTTDSFEINHDSVWQVQLGLAGTDVDGIVTLEQSADGTFWDSLPNAVAVAIPSNDSVTFEDHFFSGRYFRVVYGGGPTTGTISIILTEKS